jgi:hypothetical protein
MTIGSTRSLAHIAVVLTIVVAAEAAFAGPPVTPVALDRLPAGRLVHVTTRTPDSFDAIWIGRDGDRALLLERRDPGRAIAVRIDALLDVRALPEGGKKSNAGNWGFLGGVAGFAAALFWMRAALWS